MGRGNKNSKPTTKTRIKKEQRKKKQQPKSKKLLGQIQQEKKKQKAPFGKKRKQEKNSLHYFKIFVVKLQDIGPCFKFFQTL